MRSYIIHIDGDAFFASVETAKRPWLKGKPVVVGGDRGIASALSYEAKAKGVTRGMPVFQIRKICPDVIVLPSDYDLYALYSKRIMHIVRRYARIVEAYSIDECFADLTEPLDTSLSREDIVRKIAKDVEEELSLTVSIGLADTKVLAKVASKRNKPRGVTILEEGDREEFLKTTKIGSVWMIGSKTAAKLSGLGIFNAWDFSVQPLHWVRAHGNRPMEEIWRELRGESVYKVKEEAKEDQQSISRTQTFRPNSNDPRKLLSELSKNLENACIKARALDILPTRVSFFLKTESFAYRGTEFELEHPTNLPHQIMSRIEALFWTLFDKRILFRTTGVRLSGMMPSAQIQEDLFGSGVIRTQEKSIFECIDAINWKYGRHTISLLSSLSVYKHEENNQFLYDMKRLQLVYLGQVS
ncbi:MAG: DNA polymerase IV [Candidatus Zambryskibacteria bacterium]|nr:DNA polymerase IV [Candidatus Zambryskibacteria bacterium]